MQKMQKEEPQLSIYEYFFEGGLNNTFVFETNADILYGVKFKPSEYIIPNKAYSNSIFEMTIEILDIPAGKKLYPDKIIPPTIATIIKDFFYKIHQPILMYICDSSDDKQLVRHRKFNQWFEEFAGAQLAKTELIFIDNFQKRFPVSLFLEINHPNRQEILDLFFDEANNFQNDK